MKKNIRLAELQEILLWQSLNRQLLALKGKGKDIRRYHHKYLQAFCFDNMLFSKITGAPLLDETPLSLVSDFKSVSFLTVKTPEWERLLASLMPNNYALDLDEALAEAFDVLSEYDRKYHLTQEEGDEEDDEELYSFIEQYTNLRKKNRILDFPSTVEKSYSLKSLALEKITSDDSSMPFLKLKKNGTRLELVPAKKDEASQRVFKQISQIYLDEYCHEVESLLRSGARLTRIVGERKVLFFLEDELSKRGTKKSIRDFLRYEIPLFRKEMGLRENYIIAAKGRARSSHTSNITICDVRPFFYLKNPLPLV